MKDIIKLIGGLGIIVIVIVGLVVGAGYLDERNAKKECKAMCDKLDADLFYSQPPLFSRLVCTCLKDGEIIKVS